MPITDADIDNARWAGLTQDIDWEKTSSLTEAAGALFTLFPQAGQPGAGVITGTALAASAALGGATVGALGVPTAPTGGRTLWLYDASGFISGQAGTIEIWDRLLQIPGIDHTNASPQVFTGTLTLPRYTTGEGVMAWLEVTSALGTGAQTAILTYTDSDGNTGQTTPALTITDSLAAQRIAHSSVSIIPLAADDRGIRSPESIDFTGTKSAGTSMLVLGRRLCTIPVQAAGVGGVADLAKRRRAIEIDTSPCLMARVIYNTTTDSWVRGTLSLAQITPP